MLSGKQITELLKALNNELRVAGVTGEVGLCGGAVMCLVFKARPATKDVDAIFEPTEAIRKAARRVAAKFAVGDDWLNDAAKGFFEADPPKETVLDLSNLRVWAPGAAYMLAMKCISARFDSHDRDDVAFLIRFLELQNAKQVFDVVEQYYPRHRIPAKAQFLVEELCE